MTDFYRRYYSSLRTFIAQKIADDGLVEELTNDVLLAAINSYPSFSHRSSEFSWICGIAKHKVIDYYRKKKIKTILFSVSPVFEDIASQALTPEHRVLKNELRREVILALAELRSDYRRLLRLKYLKDLPVKKIASLLKSSIKSVESKLTRAKLKFKQVWTYDHQPG
jgi:RNA polymerase sigma-70 factor (ECF subfamily)